MKIFDNKIELINKHNINYRYGLANYYMTCDKKDQAEIHYKLAMEINPNHAVLMCCLGKVSNNISFKLTAFTLI